MNNQKAHELVSVIIPFYNSSKTILETLQSVEKQTYPAIEIIVVNDGSDEENRHYLKQIMTDYPHVQLVEQNNKGVPAARNAGARVARGVYFTFLDSDDIIKPDYLRACVEALHTHPRAKLAYTRAEFFGARTGEFLLAPYDGIKSLLQGNRIPNAVALQHSKDFWEVGGFDESFRTHEDWEYWIRLLQDDNAEVICVPDILFMYRKHDDGSSLIDQLEREPKAIQSDWQRIYEKHRQLYLQYGLGFHDLVASLNKQEEQIKHLGMQVSILER
ncbi:MAG: glycosyltransferase family A protein [Burkholderiaceae bacterium]